MEDKARFGELGGFLGWVIWPAERRGWANSGIHTPVGIRTNGGLETTSMQHSRH